MRLPISSWTNTLSKLGFRKVRRKKKRDRALQGQRLLYETLEERQLLAVDLLIHKFDVDSSGTDLQLTYDYVGNTSGDDADFTVKIYESIDGALAEQPLITHRVSPSPNSYNNIESIAADFVDPGDDYRLVAVVDSTDEEGNLRVKPADKITEFSGGVFVSSDGVLHIHGRDGDDDFTINFIDDVNDANDAVHIEWDYEIFESSPVPQSESYDVLVSTFDEIRVRAHHGDDTLDIQTAPAEPIVTRGIAELTETRDTTGAGFTFTVAEMLATSTDDIAGDEDGIAITGIGQATGDIEYSLDDGVTWTTFSDISLSNALLLPKVHNSDDVKIRLHAVTQGLFHDFLSYRGWDPSATTPTYGTEDSVDLSAGSVAGITDSQEHFTLVASPEVGSPVTLDLLYEQATTSKLSHTVLDSGDVVVAWSDIRDDAGTDVGRVYARRFQADGQTVGGELVFHTFATAASAIEAEPQVAVDGDGNILVAWLDVEDGHFYARTHLATGSFVGSAKLISEDIEVSPGVYESTLPFGGTVNNQYLGPRMLSMAMNSSGQAIFVWAVAHPEPPSGSFNPTAAYAAQLNAVTQTFDVSPVMLSDSAVTVIMAIKGGSVDIAEDGSFRTAWTENAPDPLEHLYSAVSEKFAVEGGEFESQGKTSIAKANRSANDWRFWYLEEIDVNASGAYVVSYFETSFFAYSSVWTQQFDADGDPVSAQSIESTQLTYSPTASSEEVTPVIGPRENSLTIWSGVDASASHVSAYGRWVNPQRKFASPILQYGDDLGVTSSVHFSSSANNAGDFVVGSWDTSVPNEPEYQVRHFHTGQVPELAGDAVAGPVELVEPNAVDLAQYFSDVDTSLGDQLTYEVFADSNSRPDMITPTITGNTLDLAYTPGEFGDGDLTIRATDLEGNSVEFDLVITVFAPVNIPAVLAQEFDLVTNWRLTEDEGVAWDWSGNHHHLQEVGDVENTNDGSQGGAREFDGRLEHVDGPSKPGGHEYQDGYFELAPIVAEGEDNPLSIAANGYALYGWFREELDANDHSNWETVLNDNDNVDWTRVLAAKSSSTSLTGSDDEWILTGHGSRIDFSIVDDTGTVRTVTHSFDDGDQDFDADDTYFDGEWHFVAVGYDPAYADPTLGGTGGSTWIEVNGGPRTYFATEENAYIAAPASATGTSFTLGAHNASQASNVDTMWAGALDEWGIFGGALSDSQYDYLYEMQTVTTATHGDPGSLKAYVDQNAAGVDNVSEIRFDIEGGGTHTTTVSAASEMIVVGGSSLIINAHTQPDAVGMPRSTSDRAIELTGGIGNGAAGMVVLVDDVAIRGFAINDFDNDGIQVMTGDRIAIQGNHIGTDVTGTLPQGNGGFGINLSNPADGENIVIGSPDIESVVASVAGNIVAHNASGGVIVQRMTDGAIAGNVVHDNDGNGLFIQTGWYSSIDENVVHNNDGHGIHTAGFLFGSIDQNTIRDNDGDGVNLESGANVSIRLNTIRDNTGIEIDLASDGVDPNDFLDYDSGANFLHNAPEITSAHNIEGQTAAAGTLHGDINTTFVIDFYQVSTGAWIGSSEVTTDSGGSASFAAFFDHEVPTGDSISATASEVTTEGEITNTSEMAAKKDVESDEDVPSELKKSLESGLVKDEFVLTANWRLTEEKTSEDDGNGGITYLPAIDWSSGGNDLTAHSDMPEVPGRQGGSRELNNTDNDPTKRNDYFSAAHPASGDNTFSLVEGHTIFGWFKIDNSAPSHAIGDYLEYGSDPQVRGVLAAKSKTLFATDSGDEWSLIVVDASEFLLGETTRHVELRMNRGNNSAVHSVYEEIELDEGWHFVAAGYVRPSQATGAKTGMWISIDGGEKKLVRDEDRDQPSPTAVTGTPLTLGAHSGGGAATDFNGFSADEQQSRVNSMFSGTLDEWGFAGEVLSDDQIKYLYYMQSVTSTGTQPDDDLTDGLASTGWVHANGSNEVSLLAAIQHINQDDTDGDDKDDDWLTEIRFDIWSDDTNFDDESGIYTITTEAALPNIKHRMVIAANTQPDPDGKPFEAPEPPETLPTHFEVGVPHVQLSGNEAGDGASGFVLQNEDDILNEGLADGTAIRGFIINQFDGSGIEIHTNGNVIQGNYIGTDHTGEKSEAGEGQEQVIFGNHVSGITIQDAEQNLIGGPHSTEHKEDPTVVYGNIVSGNLDVGILITGEHAIKNRVQSNYIGTHHRDEEENEENFYPSVPNGTDGVHIDAGASQNWIGVYGDGELDDEEWNVISGNDGNGVRITGVATDDLSKNTTGNVIAGNYVGLFKDGDTRVGNLGNGVLLEKGTQLNTVGTDSDNRGDTKERNYISGNAINGIYINGTGTQEESEANQNTNDNIVAGNYIGTNQEGVERRGNTANGIKIDGGSQRNRVGVKYDDDNERNLIVDNHLSGVLITDRGTNRNTIAGNYIGLTKDGNESIGNNGEGVTIAAGASQNIVGTDGSTDKAPKRRNLISGNSGTGISVQGTANAFSSNNTLAGNYIGTDKTGNLDLGNGGSGIQIGASAPTSIGIAGNDEKAHETGNLISGNEGSGITLIGTQNVVVAGNTIGQSIAENSLQNEGDGISIQGASALITIGGIPQDGEEHNQKNVIAYNAGGGVIINGPQISGVNLFANSIHSNAGLGIDLQSGTGGVSINDPGDGDTGPNNLQNYPVFYAAESLSGGGARLSGYLDTVNGRTYRIEFFSNTSLDPSGFGEGKTLIGSLSLQGNGGLVRFSEEVSQAVQGLVTATATDLSTAGGTSEFSEAATIDLDIDSDNDDTLERDAHEDDIENNSVGNLAEPGKFVILNNRDVDADGIRDYFDYEITGPASRALVEVTVEIPSSIDLNTARFGFQYDSSDPLNYAVSPQDGNLRLWNNHHYENRYDATSDDETNTEFNYITSVDDLGFSPYTWGTLTFQLEPGGEYPEDVNRTGTFYVEAVGFDPNTNGQENISLLFDPDGGEWDGVVVDTIKVQVINEITVTSSDQIAAETREASGPDEEDEPVDIGQFTISRGDGNTDGTLWVYYEVRTSGLGLSGDNKDSDGNQIVSASASGDYDNYFSTLDNGSGRYLGSVQIPHGASSVTIDVRPEDDDEKEWNEEVWIEILPHPDYTAPQAPYTPAPDTPNYKLGGALGGGVNNIANIIILDNDEIDTSVNRRNVDIESTDQTEATVGNGTVDVGLAEGDVTLTLPLTPYGYAPTYRSDDNLHPLVAVDMQLPAGDVPSHLEATLTFGGIKDGTGFVFTNIQDVPDTDETMRFVLLGDKKIQEQLRSGHYDFDIDVVATIDGDKFVRTIRGGSEIVNLVDDDLGDTEFGKRWWIDHLDKLILNDSVSASRSADDDDATIYASSRLTTRGALATTGATIIRGDRSTAWYPAKITDEHVEGEVLDTEQLEVVGPWYLDQGAQGAYGEQADYLVGAAGLAEVKITASWEIGTPEGGVTLSPDKVYQLFTTWAPGPDRAANVSYKVNGAVEAFTGLQEKEIIVDQRFTPGSTELKNQRWRSLGFYSPAEDGNGVITVTVSTQDGNDNFANGVVVADAVMVVDNWEFDTPEGSFNQLVHGAVTEDNRDDYYKAPGLDRNDGQFTLLTKNGGHYEFDHKGLLTAHQDRNKNRTSYTYEDSDQDEREDELQTIKDAYGQETIYTYDGFGDLETITDFAGRETDIIIDTDGLLIVFDLVDPENDQARPEVDFVYGGKDAQLDEITFHNSDSETRVTSIEYNNFTYRAKSVTNADSHTWSIKPQLTEAFGTGTSGKIRQAPSGKIGNEDSSGASDTFVEARAIYSDPLQHADHGGNGDQDKTWVYQLDAYGLVTALAKPKVIDQKEPEDPNDDVTIHEDAVWLYERDEHGLLEKMTEPAGGGGDGIGLDELVTTYYYDGATQTGQEKQRGNLTKIEYAQETIDTEDAPGTKISETWVYGAQNTSSYNFSLPEQYTDMAGRVTDYELDSFGNLDELRQPLGVTTKYEYTPPPEPDSSDLPGGLVKTIERAYDTPDASKVKYEYNEFPAQDGFGLVEKMTEGIGSNVELETYYQYDSGRNIALVTNDASVVGQEGAPFGIFERTVRYEYDKLDRLHKEQHLTATYGTYAETVYTYYADGNVKTLQAPIDDNETAGDFTTEYEYDALGRLTREHLPAPGGNPETTQTRPETKYEYDANGNMTKELIRREGGFQTTAYEYDERNQLIKTTYPDPGYVAGEDVYIVNENESIQPIVVYTYDMLGNLATETDPRFGGHDETTVLTKYEYDALGRLTKATTPIPTGAAAAPETLYEYFDDGQLMSVDAPSPAATVASPNLRAITSYTYDAVGQLDVETLPANASGHVLTITHEYDKRGNETSVTEAGNGKSRTTTIFYDKLDRPIAIDGPDASALLAGVSTYYVYNSAGELAHQLVYAGNIASGASSPIDDGQIELTEIHAVQDQVWQSIGVNDIAQWTEYTYDKQGRLKSTHSPDSDQDRDVDSHRVLTTNHYDIRGNLTQVDVAYKDEAGVSKTLYTNYAYDNLGRLWQTLAPSVPGEGRPESKLAFNLDGTVKYQKTKVDATTWNTASFTYDDLGRIKRTTTSDAIAGDGSLETIIVRDALGNVTRQSDEFGLETRTRYDLAGNVRWTKTDQPLVYIDNSNRADIELNTYNRYNAAGQLRWFGQDARDTDDNSVVKNYTDDTTLVYDNLGQLVSQSKVAPGIDPVTQFTYDVFGARASVTDPKNNTTTFTIDNLGRTTKDRITIVNADHDGDYTYDSFGNLLTSSNRNGETITNGFDNLGRRTDETWDNVDTHTFDYSYTGLGEVKSAGNSYSEGTISNYVYTYDDARRLSTDTQTLGPLGAGTTVFTYGYNLLGNVTSADGNLLGATADYVNTYEYDAQNRISSVLQEAASGGSSTINTKKITFDRIHNSFTVDGSSVDVEQTQVRRYDNDGSGAVAASTRTRRLIGGDIRSIQHYEGDIPAAATTNSVLPETIVRKWYERDSRGLIHELETGTYDTTAGAAKFKRVTINYDDFGQQILVQTDLPDPEVDPPDVVTEYDENGDPINGNKIGPYNRISQSKTNLYAYDNEGQMTQRITPFNTELISTTAQTTAALDWKPGVYFVELTDLQFDDVNGLFGYENSEEDDGVTVGFRLDQSSTVTPLDLVKDPGKIEFTYDTSGLNHFDGKAQGLFAFKVESLVTNATLSVDYDYVHPNLANEAVQWEAGTMKVFRAAVHEYEWDYRGKLLSMTQRDFHGNYGQENVTLPDGSQMLAGEEFTKHYLYDVHGQLISDWQTNPIDSNIDFKKAYVNERGRRVVSYENLGDGLDDQVNVLLAHPQANSMLAEEFRSDGLSPQTVWPLHDHQGKVAAGYVTAWPHSNPDFQIFSYSSLGELEFDPEESPSIGSRLIYLNGNREWDSAAKVYHSNSRAYDPELGRHINTSTVSFADGDVNLYRNAFNSHLNEDYSLSGWIRSGVTDFVTSTPVVSAFLSSQPIGLALLPLVAYDAAVNDGAYTSTYSKAFGNATIDTVVGTVTIGFVDNLEVLTVNAGDRERGYNAAYLGARIATELAVGVATAGAGTAVKGAGWAVRGAKLLYALDVANNVASVGRGAYDIGQQGGLTWGNSAQLFGGLAGVGGNVLGRAGNAGRTGRVADDVIEAQLVTRNAPTRAVAQPGPANVRVRTGTSGELRSAFAKVEPHNIGQGTATNASSRAFARRLGNATDDAGHAVGQNLGGPGGVRGGNIFPQAPSVNRGAFNQFDQQIARRVQAGDNVFVRVVPRYNAGATRPHEILYQARINGQTISRTFPNP